MAKQGQPDKSKQQRQAQEGAQQQQLQQHQVMQQQMQINQMPMVSFREELRSLCWSRALGTEVTVPRQALHQEWGKRVVLLVRGIDIHWSAVWGWHWHRLAVHLRLHATACRASQDHLS